MKKYSHSLEQFDGKIDAVRLLENVRAELEELEDFHSEHGGWQLHRTSVIGKKLTAFVHNRNIYDLSDFPYICEVRVEGQYQGHGSVYLASKYDAESLRNDFNSLESIGLKK